jgi:hypothetical protein
MENFQQNIKKAFETPVPEWDKDQMWNDIEPMLPVKKRKNRIFFFWLLLGAGLAGGWMFFGQQDNVKQSTDSPQNMTPETKKNEVGSTMEFVSENQNNKTQKTSTTPSSNILKKNSLNSRKVYGYIGGSRTQDTEKISTEDNQKEMVFVTEVPSSSFDSKQQLIKNAPINSDLTIVNHVNQNQLFIDQKETVLPRQPLFFAYLISGTKEVFAESTHKLPAPDHLMTITSKTEKNLTGNWFITTNLVVSQAAKNTSILVPEAQSWSDKRRSIESVKESFTSSLMIHKKLSSSFSLGAGLQYQRINEVVQTRDIRQTVTELPSDSAFYYNSVDGKEYFSGNITQIKTTGFDIYAPNSLTRWSIPVLVRYHLQWRKLRIEPSLGLQMTFYQQYQGIHVGPDGNMIYKDKAMFASVYKPTGLLSWSGGLDIRLWEIRDYTISMGLFFQQDLNSVLRSEHGLSERYNHKGLSLEVRKNLGR